MTEYGGDPRFADRAYMLDISRGRVPRRATLAWLIEVLAELRFTELQLYVEHTFAYPGHEEVWRKASPLTADDLRWIGARAAKAGLRLVANLNCFGHMERWLGHEDYRRRAECPDGFPALFGDGVSPPTCLAPNAENAEFGLELIRAQLAAIGGDRVMIGADEPFELGLGRSRDEVAVRGRAAVYRDHVHRLAAPLVADGIEVMIWGDQFRRDPAAAAGLPNGVTIVPWNYEAPGRSWSSTLPISLVELLGLPDDDGLGCAAHIRAVTEAGVPFWVAAGTGSWNSLIGRNGNAAANIDDMASVGAGRGATGFLVCEWGDLGHWQPLTVSLPSLVRASVAAMTGTCASMGADEVGSVIDDLLDAAPGTGAVLDEIGHIGEELGPTMANGTPVAAAVLDVPFPMIGDIDMAAAARAIDLVEGSVGRWGAALPGTERGSIIAQELEAIGHAALLALRRLAGRMVGLDEIEAVKDRQRAAWLRSSRSGGLDESLARFH